VGASIVSREEPVGKAEQGNGRAIGQIDPEHGLIRQIARGANTQAYGSRGHANDPDATWRSDLGPEWVRISLPDLFLNMEPDIAL